MNILKMNLYYLHEPLAHTQEYIMNNGMVVSYF